jgi:iron complex outermembrane receptor protein
MRRTVIALGSLGLFISLGSAAQARPDTKELADLSLEQLSDVVVTSVSRQEERLSDAAASAFVITGTDILRSGVRSIPEALRLAPNLQVAKLDARNYAITARGFNSPFENKLLVLIDGRSIYSPLFSGVYWDAQDVAMEDIERIEVISGPGATIWGANAVNGVINVITKNARDTQGGLASMAAGEEARDGMARYGGTFGENGHYRVYGKHAQADETVNERGVGTSTEWRRNQAGFRVDWSRAGLALSASGDAYQGVLAQLGTPDILISGANVLSRMERSLDDGGSLRLDVVLDHTERKQPLAFDQTLDILDIQLQHGLRLGERHQLIWGAGYRYAWDRLVNGPALGFFPAHFNLHWGNVFMQDEIALSRFLKLTAGLKFEHDTYVGGEYLPSLRLAWEAGPSTLVWGSLTRSVRTPSRIDHDLYSPTQPRIVNGKPFYLLGGGPDFVSEVARTAELGYRFQATPAWTYSATVYFTDFDRLRTLEPQPNGAPAAAVFRNFGRGTLRGIEMWATWQPTSYWRMNGGLVVQHLLTGVAPGGVNAAGDSGLETNDPAQHWLLRSSLDLSEHVMLDLHLRHTGALPRPAVPSYTELEAQLLWRPRADIEVALIGQNLLHRRHVEFGGGTSRSALERGVQLKLSKRF